MSFEARFIEDRGATISLPKENPYHAEILTKLQNNERMLSDLDVHMEKIERVEFMQGDLLDSKIEIKIFGFFQKKIDVVISDMAANTSGNKNLDSYKTGELCLRAMDLALKILNKDGVFLSKLFMGSVFEEINKNAKKYFKKVVKYKPLSSKKESKEIYIYCKGIWKVI